jgi:hypothetical protein
MTRCTCEKCKPSTTTNLCTSRKVGTSKVASTSMEHLQAHSMNGVSDLKVQSEAKRDSPLKHLYHPEIKGKKLTKM